MINTIFHFVNDPTFDYQTAVNNGDISEYTIVFNSADHSIRCKGTWFGNMERANMAEVLGNLSDILPPATEDSLGAVMLGFVSNTEQNSRKYALKLDSNNRAYVEVPWTDTITPEFDDSELISLINAEKARVTNLINTIGDTVDAKNRQLYADGDWVREIFGNQQTPGTVANAYRTEMDQYLKEFDVWEYIDPEHPELGKRSKINELENTTDGLIHRMGQAETRITSAEGNISTTTVKVSTLEHNLDGLTSNVTSMSDDLATVTRKESALEQTVDSIGLRVTNAEANVSNLQTQEASLQVQADKIESRVVATENSVNGCYKVAIVSNPSNAASAVEVSTISAKVAARESLSDNQLINDEDFTTAPTAETLYKNSVPQYFTFSRYKGLTVRASDIEQTVDAVTLRVGTVEGDVGTLTTKTSTLEQTANSLSGRVGSVEQQANATDVALAALDLQVTGTGGVKESLASLSSSLTNYESSTDDALDNIIKMAASVLDLKTSQNGNTLQTTSDLASVITNGSWTGFSGLNTRVTNAENGITSNAGLVATAQSTANTAKTTADNAKTAADNAKTAADNAQSDLDSFKNNIATTIAQAGFASTAWVGQNYDALGAASTAESNANGYADTKKSEAIAAASSTMYATVDAVCAGIGVTVTKNQDGSYNSVTNIDADNINLNGQTNFQTAVGAFIKTDVLEAGVATVKANLTVGGSDPSGGGTAGTITMKNASNTTIGVWDKNKFAVGTTSSPSSSNSAMLINADGSGSAAKGNISWNANGDVTVKGTLDGCDGTFTGSLSAVSLSGMTITGDQIEGGSIVVGGSGNATNGSVVVKDINDTEVGRLDKTGVSASQGTIGGFSISSDELSNSNYNASISISNSNNTQISRIGKDATDAMTNQSCSLEAQSKGTGTYNTALYLNADGATYNYAFHGNGNGVLNGLVFGFKTKVYTISGSTDTNTQMSITDGATFVIQGSKTSGWANFKVPTLDNVKQALGLPTTSTTPFAIEVNFINHSSYDHVSLQFYNSSRTSLPKWYNYDFDSTTQDMQLAKGDFARFLLTYDGSNYNGNYRANRIIHHDGAWG